MWQLSVPFQAWLAAYHLTICILKPPLSPLTWIASCTSRKRRTSEVKEGLSPSPSQGSCCAQVAAGTVVHWFPCLRCHLSTLGLNFAMLLTSALSVERERGCKPWTGGFEMVFSPVRRIPKHKVAFRQQRHFRPIRCYSNQIVQRGLLLEFMQLR